LAALEALIAKLKVRCEVIERDRPVVAKVYSPNGIDIGRRWCRRGRHTVRYSMDYVAAEDEARKAKRGTCVAPVNRITEHPRPNH
jgi:endonuclease YncB( thermonuclease family)